MFPGEPISDADMLVQCKKFLPILRQKLRDNRLLKAFFQRGNESLKIAEPDKKLQHKVNNKINQARKLKHSITRALNCAHEVLKEAKSSDNAALEGAREIVAHCERYPEWIALLNEPQQPKGRQVSQADLPDKSMQELLDEDWRAISRQCGPTYVAWIHIKQSGMLRDLEAAFDKEDAAALAALAVYALCQPAAAMENFASWLGGVYLADVEPLSGQRISEILSRVSRDKMDRFFKYRFDHLLTAAREDRSRRAKIDPKAKYEPLSIAFDSTSISTYSSTIDDAEYGKAKDNPELKQVNLTLACDQQSGEVLYAREYAGSINDVASFSTIFKDMSAIGFHVEDIEFVTDRGYKSANNTQLQLDAGVKFVQGLRIDEDGIKGRFDKHMNELRGNGHYVPELGYSALSLPKEESELWQRNIPGGQEKAYIKTHLYFSDDLALNAKKALLTKVDNIIKLKNDKRPVPIDDWARFSKCVSALEQKPNKILYVRNMQEINRRLRYAGCFAIRTNYRNNPIDALKIYRQRAKVEAQYRIFKSDIEGRRMRATQLAYLGKLFIFTLATSVRSMLSNTLRKLAENKNCSIPNNSLDTVLAELSKVTIHRRGDRLCWRPDMLTKKQREYFALLDVIPPKGLFRN